jgi:hypothetical protein
MTESIALPPRPRGGQYVGFPRIQSSRVARASGIAAALLRAVGRRYIADSMVVGFGVPSPSDQASSSLDSEQSPLACELNSRAVDALGKAQQMPSGDERAAAMRSAAVLENAAEILGYFSATKQRKQNDDAAEVSLPDGTVPERRVRQQPK